MSTTDEISEMPEKYRVYRDRLAGLFGSYDVKSLQALVTVYRSNAEFRAEWKAIWSDIAKSDGGKLSLTTIGVIVGSVLGGVGIAAMGGAIGLPLALVLGLGGLLSGSKFDSLGIFSGKKKIRLKVSEKTYDCMKDEAAKNGMSINDLAAQFFEVYARTEGSGPSQAKPSNENVDQYLNVTPDSTLSLIESLEQRGLTDDLFKRLHHLGQKSSLEAHKKYLETTGSYKIASNNLAVHERLQRLDALMREVDGSE